MLELFCTFFSRDFAGTFRRAVQQKKRKENEQVSTFCRWCLGIFLPVFTVHPCDPRCRRPSSLSAPFFSSASLSDGSSVKRGPGKRSTSCLTHQNKAALIHEYQQYRWRKRIIVFRPWSWWVGLEVIYCIGKFSVTHMATIVMKMNYRDVLFVCGA